MIVEYLLEKKNLKQDKVCVNRNGISLKNTIFHVKYHHLILRGALVAAR